MKKFKTSLLLLLSFFIFPLNLFAYSSKIYAGGENIGIEVDFNGVLVVGSYEVNGVDPLKTSNIKIGDVIVAINNHEVKSIDEMIKEISASNTDNLKITYKRDNKTNVENLKITKDKGLYKTGLYVKDSITGIGTLTFIDPETNYFGALGHEVADTTTGIMLEIKNGSIFTSKVTSIDRSWAGEPGSKNATINNNNIIGHINENERSGIFGVYQDKINKDTLYEVAKPKDIKLGKATIKTVLSDTTVEEYEINILKINKNDENLKNILFEIKDKNLLEKTGGIVQGMSGSPIIQDNKIIGAVTHVVVNEPNRGYGIFITTMLEEAEN